MQKTHRAERLEPLEHLHGDGGQVGQWDWSNRWPTSKALLPRRLQRGDFFFCLAWGERAAKERDRARQKEEVGVC